MRLPGIALVGALLLLPLSAEAAAARPTTRDRLTANGDQTAVGPTFSIHIKLVETRPRRSGRDRTLCIWDAQITENATGQRMRGHGRLEPSLSDMYLPVRWQFRDLNGDRFIDYRYDKGETGSPDWRAWVWQSERQHGGLTFSPRFSGER